MSAALNTAVITIPQAMAYALLAGVPPAYGLYTAVVGGLIGSVFGSSRHLITGPTNATSILFASIVAGYYGGATPLEAVFLFTLLVGVIKAAFGLARLGKLVNFLSDSVVIGFLAGAGVLIAGEQLRNCLGIDLEAGAGEHFVERVRETIARAAEANGWAVAVSLGTIGIVVGVGRWRAGVPGALVALAAMAAASSLLGLPAHGVATIGDIASIPRALPPLSAAPIDFAEAGILLPGALAVAVISLMEATAIGRSIGAQSGQRIDANREFLGQGLAGVVGAFLSNYPSSASLVRSMAHFQAGARTRWAGALSALVVGVVVLVAGPLAESIPIAALAGLLMVIAYKMVDRARLARAVLAGRESAIILVATFLGVLFLRLDFAIYLGVFTSLAFYIKRSSATEVAMLARRSHGRFREQPLHEADPESLRDEPLLLNLTGPLYFGALDEWRRPVLALVDAGVCAVVVRVRRVTSIDSSAVESFERLHRDLAARGVPLILCGVDEELMAVFRRTGLVARIGEDHVVPAKAALFDSFLETVRYARQFSSKRPPSRGAGDQEPMDWTI